MPIGLYRNNRSLLVDRSASTALSIRRHEVSGLPGSARAPGLGTAGICSSSKNRAEKRLTAHLPELIGSPLSGVLH